jgi:hypothetical protein
MRPVLSGRAGPVVSFLLWGLASGLWVFSAIAAASIGIFGVPSAALAVVVAVRRAAPGPALFGLGFGPAAVLLLIGMLNLDYAPCGPGGVPVMRPGQTEASCGGLNPVAWFVAGGLLLALTVIAFVVAASHHRAPRMPAWTESGDGR